MSRSPLLWWLLCALLSPNALAQSAPPAATGLLSRRDLGALNGPARQSDLAEETRQARLNETAALNKANAAIPAGGAVDNATTLGRTLAARAADVFNPRDYGAIGDGALHSASTVLGVSTLAALAAYAAPDGSHPYSWVNAYPYGTLFNLPASSALAAGNATVSFGASRLTSAQAASGSIVLQLADITGVYQGMTVIGPGIALGAQVEFVNTSTLQIIISKPLSSTVAPSTTLSFAQPWLAKVAPGMRVTSPVLPPNTTVQAVSERGVTLSAALTASAVAVTPNTASRPAYEGTAFTFYAPFTDAQAAALQMDTLGIQAAEKAAEGNGGGAVEMPRGVKWEVDQTIIFPTTGPSDQSSPNTPGVTLAGVGKSSTTLEVIADLGPSRYALSCGDPTATLANMRGIYASQGSFCEGDWRELAISMRNGAGAAYGHRPVLGGVPVIMGGVKQGPRRNMRSVVISQFNVGIQFQGDWTTWDYVQAGGNFIGFRLDDPMPFLYGDLRFEQVFFGGSGLAGISVSPQSALLGVAMNKSWVADSPYQILFEPGATAGSNGTAMAQFAGTNDNFEGAGCAAIKDANGSNGIATFSGASRGFDAAVHFDSTFFSTDVTHVIPGYCTAVAYFDVDHAYGLQLTNIPSNSLEPAAGAAGMMRLNWTSDYDYNRGGVLISGLVKDQLDAYAAAGQEIVGGPSTFALQSSFNVAIEIPGIGRLRQVFYNPSDATPLARGTLLEAGNYFHFLSGQRSGTYAAGAAQLLGSVFSAYAASMAGKHVPIMVEGQMVPVAVSAAQLGMSQLQVDPSNPGKAMAAADVNVGRQIGFVADVNSGSASLVYATADFLAPAWPGIGATPGTAADGGAAAAEVARALEQEGLRAPLASPQFTGAPAIVGANGSAILFMGPRTPDGLASITVPNQIGFFAPGGLLSYGPSGFIANSQYGTVTLTPPSAPDGPAQLSVYGTNGGLVSNPPFAMPVGSLVNDGATCPAGTVNLSTLTIAGGFVKHC